MQGSAGCNTYHGGYALTQDAMTVTPLASTMMYCGFDPVAMPAESNFLKNVGDAKIQFSIEGREMVWALPNGDTMHWMHVV
jgi:heat shock protein HslJ